jgi:hypothetical protein
MNTPRKKYSAMNAALRAIRGVLSLDISKAWS